MSEFRVLLTGAFWHSDFAEVISSSPFPITLQPFENLNLATLADEFQLIILAQSRRGEFDRGAIENLQRVCAHIPLVALVGSWCEGELRSGDPPRGLVRMYWHQWQGRLDQFLEQLQAGVLAQWQLPAIASLADRVVHEANTARDSDSDKIVVGISALNTDAYLMVADACCHANATTFWIEKEEWRGDDIDVICIDAQSLDQALLNRIVSIQAHHRKIPMVLLMNFPRRHEFDAARDVGVSEIVSKPFELADLQMAFRRALGQRG